MELKQIGPREAAYRRRTRRATRIMYCGAVVVTLIAYAVNIPRLEAGKLPNDIGWGFVLLTPPAIFAILIGAIKVLAPRDIRRYRMEDAAESHAPESD